MCFPYGNIVTLNAGECAIHGDTRYDSWDENEQSYF